MIFFEIHMLLLYSYFHFYLFKKLINCLTFMTRLLNGVFIILASVDGKLEEFLLIGLICSLQTDFAIALIRTIIKPTLILVVNIFLGALFGFENLLSFLSTLGDYFLCETYINVSFYLWSGDVYYFFIG